MNTRLIDDSWPPRMTELQRLADEMPPHSTLLCYRVIEGAQWCGAELAHIAGGVRRDGSVAMLTVCPRCDGLAVE